MDIKIEATDPTTGKLLGIMTVPVIEKDRYDVRVRVTDLKGSDPKWSHEVVLTTEKTIIFGEVMDYFQNQYTYSGSVSMHWNFSTHNFQFVWMLDSQSDVFTLTMYLRSLDGNHADIDLHYTEG